MRKFVMVSLLVISVMTLQLFGCAEPTKTPSSTPATTPAPAPATPLPQFIRMGSSPAGQMGYVWATASAKVISNHTPMSIKVEPYTSTSVFRELINDGELQIGWNSPSDLYDSYRSTQGYTPAPNIRMLLVGPTLLNGMVVRADSGMKETKDIKGKRLCGEFKGQTVDLGRLTSLLTNAGMTWDDVKMVPVVNSKGARDGLREGKLDVALASIGSSDAEELNASIPGGIRFLSIDPSPNAIANMQKVMVGSEVTRVDKGTGILAPTYIQLSRMVLITNKNTDERVIYEMTKALWDNLEELRPFHEDSLKDMKQSNVIASEIAVIPYHPGAIKFFKEKGDWTAKEDAVQAKLLKEGKQ
jgi:uncharacterized protein